jgi:hypothetical protein
MHKHKKQYFDWGKFWKKLYEQNENLDRNISTFENYPIYWFKNTLSLLEYIWICIKLMTLKKNKKTKLLKRVKYHIFLQNNMFIPRAVSDKILKLQHHKELVVDAMLNFWIKWKTCNVENHPSSGMNMLFCRNMWYLTLLRSFVFVHRKSNMATTAGQIKKIHLRN